MPDGGPRSLQDALNDEPAEDQAMADAGTGTSAALSHQQEDMPTEPLQVQ